MAYNYNMAESTELKHLSWDEVTECCKSILDQLKSEGIVIDTILGIARGGMVPATIMSYSLEKPQMEMLGVRTREVESTEFYGHSNLFGNVLVVDDINDSGRTFKEVSEYLAQHFERGELGEIYYSACVRRQSSQWQDGYYGIEHEGDAWYVFPWDK
jgi:uncharacterized protein